MSSFFSLIKKFIKYFMLARRSGWNYQILFACDIFLPNLPTSTRIGHPVGIVISDLAVLGENCTLLQNVTIAQKNKKAPVIGDNVYIGAGAIILGDIKIGNNVTIGAGAIVVKDIPPNTIYFNKVTPIYKNKLE